MAGIPVLMYHALEDCNHPAGSLDAGERVYVLQVEQFRAQMEYLHLNGFRTVLLNELDRLPPSSEKVVMVTFDDGHESNFTLALPILAKFGFKAEFFVTTNWIGKERYLKRSQIRELYDLGMGIGSHGATHSFLSDLEADLLGRELEVSRRALADVTGELPVAISCPGGRCSGLVEACCRSTGYRRVLLSRPQLFVPHRDTFLVPRIPVRRSTKHSQFRSLLMAGCGSLMLAGGKYAVTSSLKSLLGNRCYDVLRRTALKVADLT